MTIETINAVLGVINNPLVQFGGALAGAAGLAVAAHFIRSQPQAADVAQDVADLSEEIEPWVIELEKTLLRGEFRYSTVLDKAQAWMKAQGITGRRGRVIAKYLPILIESTVKKVRANQ